MSSDAGPGARYGGATFQRYLNVEKPAIFFRQWIARVASSWKQTGGLFAEGDLRHQIWNGGFGLIATANEHEQDNENEAQSSLHKIPRSMRSMVTSRFFVIFNKLESLTL